MNTPLLRNLTTTVLGAAALLAGQWVVGHSLAWCADELRLLQEAPPGRGGAEQIEVGPSAADVPGGITDEYDGYDEFTDMAGPSCSSEGCAGHHGTRPPHWGNVEYLLWWSKGRGLPPLVTTSPPGTLRSNAGILGLPTTSVLYGNEHVGGDVRSGGRLELGYWLDDCEILGVGGRFFALGGGTDGFRQGSSGDPILARPFFNVVGGRDDAVLIAFPDIATGTVDITTSSDVLGGDVFFRELIYRDQCNRLDFVMGYQFGQIEEDLVVSHSLVSRDPNGTVPIGTAIDTFDQFDATNEFHGGELGLLIETRWHRWNVELLAKVGLGSMRQTVTINGSTTTTEPAAQAVTNPGGLLALPTNIGVFEQDTFTVVPELGIAMSMSVSCHLDFRFGYSFIYWSQVAQPGEQIDLGVNLSQVTGPLVGDARPAFSFDDDDYWVQGINFSLQWHY